MRKATIKHIPWRRSAEIVYDANARDELYEYIRSCGTDKDIFVNPDDDHEDLDHIRSDEDSPCRSHPSSVRGLSSSYLLVASS
jgi:hypothetical protein